MKNILLLTTFLAATLFLGSCAEGPQGPDPGSELYIEYEGSLSGQMLQQRRSSVVYMSGVQQANGTTKPFDFLFTQSSRVVGNEVQFHLGVNPSVTPYMSLYVGTTLPSSPGTFAWKAADLSTGLPPQSVVVENGPKILYDGGLTFFPVSGETVILNVTKEGSNVTFIEGYFNGTMRSISGQTMTVQSALFRHPRP